MKVPDPFLGPKGVRILLVQRGVFGCVVSLCTSPICYPYIVF